MDKVSDRLDLNSSVLKILAGFLNWKKISSNYVLDENFDEVIDWDIVFQTRKLTQRQIQKNLNRTELKHALKYQAFSETLLRYALKNVTNKEIWDIVSGEQSLSERFMNDFFNNLNKDILIRNQYLSGNFIKKHFNELNIELLIQYQILPDDIFLRDFSQKEWKLISRYQNIPTKILKVQNTKIIWGDLFKYNNNQDFNNVYKLPHLKTYCNHISNFETVVYDRSLRLLDSTELNKLDQLIKKNNFNVDLSWQPNINPSIVTDWSTYVKWHPIDVNIVETYKIPKFAYIFQNLSPSFIAHFTEDESIYQKNLKILFRIFEYYYDKMDNKPFIKLKHDLIQGKIKLPTLDDFKMLLPNISIKIIESAFDHVDMLFFKLTHGIGDVKAKDLLIEKKKFERKVDQNRAMINILTENQKQSLKYTLDMITPMMTEDYELVITHLEDKLSIVGENGNRKNSYTDPVITIVNWQNGFPGYIKSDSNLLHTEIKDKPIKTILDILKPSIIHILSSGPHRAIVLLKVREHVVKVICYNLLNTYMGCLYLFHRSLYDFITHNKTRFDGEFTVSNLSYSLVGKYEKYIKINDLCFYIPQKKINLCDITII